MPDDVLWDAAIHVYDDAYPRRAGLAVRLPHAPISRYLASRGSGIGKVVLSQASAYGFDNSLLIDTLGTLSGKGRGIVVLPPTQSDAELRQLHERGVRGVRFMMFEGGALGWDDVAPWAAQAANMDWVLKFQLNSGQFHARMPLLRTLLAKSIIDVYPGTLDLTAQTLDRLADLLGQGRTWLSLTAPSAEDTAFNAVVLDLINAYPHRCLWASNWPSRMSEPRSPMETGAAWLADLVGEDRARVVMMNAGQLFGT